MLKVETRSVEQVLTDLRQIARELSARNPRAERIARMVLALEETVARRTKPAVASPSGINNRSNLAATPVTSPKD
jgi:hypothetical protein